MNFKSSDQQQLSQFTQLLHWKSWESYSQTSGWFKFGSIFLDYHSSMNIDSKNWAKFKSATLIIVLLSCYQSFTLSKAIKVDIIEIIMTSNCFRNHVFWQILDTLSKINYIFVKLNNSYLKDRKSDWAEIWREYIILNLKGTFVSLKTG